MPDLAAYKVDAFTDRAYGGNPAGVVPDAASLTEAQMRAIAREMNLSETAFLLPPTSPAADLRVRFFTPTSEIPLCGHATIASFHLLRELGRIGPGVTRLETNVGVLPVEVRADGRAFLQSDPLTFAPSPATDAELARLLGVAREEVLPGARLVRGKLIAPVRGLKTLETAKPDFRGILALAPKGVQGLAPLSYETRTRGPLTHVRYFAPSVGIDEDPVTGTAHIALGGYLVEAGKIGVPAAFVGEQGDFCGRPGLVEVEVSGTRDAPVVRVGGRAVTVLRGTMAVP